MREFKSFGEFAKHLQSIPKRQKLMIKAVAVKSGEMVKQVAQEKIGFYQTQSGPFVEWSPLAESTMEERVELGFSANDPLLRTGALRDSISFDVATPMPWLTNVVVGSVSEIALYQERGTSRIPPRAFLGPALYEQSDTLRNMLGRATLAVLCGMEFRV